MSGTIADHAAAVCEAINAQEGAAFTVGELKALTSKPAAYNEVTVLKKPAESRRYGGISDLSQWTVLVRAVAQREENATTMRQRAHDALDDQVLVIGGVETSPVSQAVTDDPIGPDDGWFSGLSEWSYGH